MLLIEAFPAFRTSCLPYFRTTIPLGIYPNLEEFWDPGMEAQEFNLHGVRDDDLSEEPAQNVGALDLEKGRDRGCVADDDHREPSFDTVSMSAMASRAS